MEVQKSRPFRRLNFLPSSRSPSGVGGFKANEHTDAPGLRSQRQELFLIVEVNAGLGNPLLSQVRLCHGTEQVLGAGDVLMARADEVVVHHQHMLFTDQLKFPHHIRNESLPVVGPVQSRHAAKVAVQWTAAGGLNGPLCITRSQQIMPGESDIVYLGQPSVRHTGASGSHFGRPSRTCGQIPSSSPVAAESTRPVTSSNHMVL